MAYYDSLGNRYERLPPPKKPHKAKPSKGGAAKIGRSKAKCERYRALVGKPNGPGQPGKKTR